MSKEWDPGYTKQVKNILADSTIQKVLQGYLRTSLRSNLTHWEANIVGTSGPIFLYELKVELMQEIKDQVCKHLPEDAVPLPWSIQYTVGSRYSYLSWHRDIIYDYSCTIYLNDNWDKEYHGYLIYESPDGLRAILPEYNTAFFFKPPLHHSTTMPTIQAPLRHSLQIFVGKKE
jgi:hypothetical protein